MGQEEGTCLSCNKKFKSKDLKFFCTIDCYLKSNQWKAIQHNLKQSKTTRGKVCENCNVVLDWKPSGNKYCSDKCRREFYATRFDRWIANPEEIALPQNYDEFLLKEKLPCLIKNCTWEGDRLSFHCNVVHGIKASDLKKICGFNVSTGLDSQKTKKKQSESQRKSLEEAPEKLLNLKKGNKTFFEKQRAGLVKMKSSKERLERREHVRKATLTRSPVEAILFKDQICQNCLQKFDRISTNGKPHKYCSDKCRAEYHKEKYKKRYLKLANHPLTCSHCGKDFFGKQSQFLRFEKGQNISCSLECRQKMNGATRRNKNFHHAKQHNNT